MHRVGLALALVVAVMVGAVALAQQEAAPQLILSGNYADLRPEQKRLVDDWVRRFAETMKKTVDPAEAYNNLPLSTKTTFNGVTHALLRTKLTGKDGASLGPSALSLVEKVDQVMGMVPGGGGDEQFRLYVELRPDAQEILGKVVEFGRKADNTVFHKGYPICFRGTSGTPSIQVSIARTGIRADIDVDYRSSQFPVFLFNGHLSASNSDVRAGDNDTRHNGQWTGLNNWWRGLLGLFTIEQEDKKEAANADASHIPQVPQIAKDAPPAEAIHAFLNTWLVEQRPAEVIPYFDNEAIDCLQLQSTKAIDYGMLRFAALAALQRRSEQLGKISSLAGVVEGVEMPGVRVKRRSQPHEAEFVLYDIREDLVEQLRCGTRLDPTRISMNALKSTSYKKYVAAIFKMKTGSALGDTTATIWTKQNGYWRLITYINEPQVEVGRALRLPTAPVSTAPRPMVDADPALIKAATNFHTEWFVRGDLTEAMSYLSPACLPCIIPYVEEGSAVPATASEQEYRIRDGMMKIMKAAKALKLTDAITPTNVTHPDLKLVKQPNSAAFVMAAMPDYLFAEVDCTRSEADRARAAAQPPGELSYGKYYASGFRLVKAVEDPAVLLMVWAKVDGAWKIVTFQIVTP
jgi:hypothetical protein